MIIQKDIKEEVPNREPLFSVLIFILLPDKGIA